jgi:hypothetical protein
MGSKLRTSIRLQLVSPGAQALFIDTDDFVTTLGVIRLRGRLVICDIQGTFECRIGNQTSVYDIEIPDAPNLLTGAGTNNAAYLNAINRYFIDYDPTAANNGVINGKDKYRNGIWYHSSNATISRGEVILELWEES